MNVGRFVIARISAIAISTLSVPMPVEHDGHALATVRTGDRGELAVPALELDVVEQPGDLGGAVGVAGEEEVLGQLAGAEIDVVLPLPVGERDAVVRVRQEPVLLLALPRLRNSRQA